MKRLHVHIRVDDLQKSIDFYSRLLGEPPSFLRQDYAQWSPEAPSLNLAVSTHHGRGGLAHLGIETSVSSEVEGLANAVAESLTLDEGRTSCCYAVSDKRWVEDPDGVRWELFHTSRRIDDWALHESGSGRTDAADCCTHT